MLATTESKLLAKWQGPFEVQRKFGPTTYKLSLPGHPKSSKVLHVNLLKEWVPLTESAAGVLLIRSVEEVDDQYLLSPMSFDLDLSHLSEVQQSQTTSTDYRVSLIHMGEDEARFCARSRRGGNEDNGESGVYLEPDREKRYAELFEQLDLNKDGRVDIHELRTVLAAWGLHRREAEEVR
ncbi:hypothetical protein LDENG_00259490 [Lucifuga dentata]|nr:hypothetical protein LDENG_00259490 [Lucifuga dentata]